MTKPVYVYIIGPSGGPFKIGIATNIRSRLSSIQTGFPHRIGCVVAYQFPDAAIARTVERKMHAQFRAFHLRGEWFSIDASNASDALRACGGALVEMRAAKKPHVVGDDGSGLLSEEVRKAMFFESMNNYQKGLTAEQIAALSRVTGPECDGPALIERLWLRTL